MELGLPSTGTTGARRGRSRLQPGPEDLAAHERARGRIPPGACVALRSGWDAHVATPRFRNADASGALRFPASPRRGAAAARARRRRRGGGHAGRWTLRDFALHLAWLGAGRWGLECAANLGALPPTGATIVVGRRGSRAAPAGRAAGRAARWRSCDARPTAATAPARPRRRSAPSAAPASAPSAAVNIAAGVVR